MVVSGDHGTTSRPNATQSFKIPRYSYGGRHVVCKLAAGKLAAGLSSLRIEWPASKAAADTVDAGTKRLVTTAHSDAAFTKASSAPAIVLSSLSTPARPCRAFRVAAGT